MSLPIRLETSLEMVVKQHASSVSPMVLATLVATSGSTYRKPGARMLIGSDGRYYGLLSGGCLESDLIHHANQVMASGRAIAIEYDMRGPDDELFGFGAGCEGAMRILLERLEHGSRASENVKAAVCETSKGNVATLISIYESRDTPLGTYRLTDDLPIGLKQHIEDSIKGWKQCQMVAEVHADQCRALLHRLFPIPHILICGAGPDAQPVVSQLLSLGWRVSVVDHRASYATGQRFPGAEVFHNDASQLSETIRLGGCHAAVVMSHHLPTDIVYLRELAALETPGFIGLLGPTRRRQRIAMDLGETMRRLEWRLHGPVGLPIGAVTPEGIALSVASQIHSWIAALRQPTTTLG